MTYLKLHPEWGVYRRWSGGVPAVLVALAALLCIGVIGTWGQPHALLAIGGIFLLVLIIAVPALAHVAIMVRTSSLTLDAKEVVHRRYGRSTTLRFDAGITGLLAPYVTSSGSGGGSRTVDMLILVGGGRRIRLNGGYWARADLEAVARAAGAGIDKVPRSAHEWERDWPGSMGFVARRPVATAFLIVLVLFALIAAAIAVGGLLSQ